VQTTQNHDMMNRARYLRVARIGMKTPCVAGMVSANQSTRERQCSSSGDTSAAAHDHPILRPPLAPFSPLLRDVDGVSTVPVLARKCKPSPQPHAGSIAERAKRRCSPLPSGQTTARQLSGQMPAVWGSCGGGGLSDLLISRQCLAKHLAIEKQARPTRALMRGSAARRS